MNCMTDNNNNLLFEVVTKVQLIILASLTKRDQPKQHNVTKRSVPLQPNQQPNPNSPVRRRRSAQQKQCLKDRSLGPVRTANWTRLNRCRTGLSVRCFFIFDFREPIKTNKNRTDKTGSNRFVTVVVQVYILAKFLYNFHPNWIKTG